MAADRTSNLVVLFCGLLLTSVAFTAGCGGGGDDGDPVAPCEEAGGEGCFELPTAPLLKGDTTTPANFNCSMPASTQSTGDIEVQGIVDDFENGDAIPNANVSVYYSLDDLVSGSAAASATSASDGQYSLTMSGPVPSRVHWYAHHEDALDTYGINIEVDTTQTSMEHNRASVSRFTANAISAFIGILRNPDLGVLAGFALDCDGDLVENAIATVSSTSSVGDLDPSFVFGAMTFYFSNGDPDLPVRRNLRKATAGDGLFVIIEIPPTTGAQRHYLQVWGYPTQADVDQGASGLKLLSGIQAPAFPDSVLAVDMDPTEGPL